jgi:putative SOS response-associated peptidase YedK
MLPFYTISTKPEHIAEQFNLLEATPYENAYQAHPGTALPILIKEDEQVQQFEGSWEMKASAKSTRMIPFVSMDNILTTRPFNVLLRKQRCVVPVNCFFGIKNDKPYVIKLLKDRLFGMGGIYTLEQKNGVPIYRFAILTTAAPPILTPYLDQIPVLFVPDRHDKWLGTDRVAKVMKYADYAATNWFDLFEVSDQILQGKPNEKTLLTPVGPSLSQLMAQQNKVQTEALEKMRGHRGK